jgi:hypothetical protein
MLKLCIFLSAAAMPIIDAAGFDIKEEIIG